MPQRSLEGEWTLEVLLGYRAYGEDGLEHHLTVAMVWTGRWQ
jgi:hypothetical protein